MHCIRITFPMKEEMNKTPKVAKYQKNKLKVALPQIKKSFENTLNKSASYKYSFDPEDLNQIPRTSIRHIEDTKDQILQWKTKLVKNNNSNQYIQFCNKIDKERAKRLAKRNKKTSRSKDNPWRYAITSPQSIFDISLVAQKTFHLSSEKKSFDLNIGFISHL